MRVLAGGLLIVAAGLHAQTIRDGTVDVTVSRLVAPGGLEAVFRVDATTGAFTSVEGVAAALAPVGVRAQHFRGVFVEAASARYSFDLRVPAARLEPLSIEMDRLFRAPPPPLTQFRFTARLEPSGAAMEAARLAALPGLFEEARAQAEAAFAAAGQTPGPVLALQDEISGAGDATATVKLSLRMARLGSSRERGVIAAVTRPLTVPFDVAVIVFSVGGGTEGALRKLAPLGVTAAQMTSQSVSPLSVSTSFEVIKPAGELPQFLEALAKLGLNFGARLDYSPGLRAREKDKAIPGMLEEARGRAEPLARLLNLPVKGVRSIEDNAPPVSTTFFASFLLIGPPVPASDIGFAVEFAVD